MTASVAERRRSPVTRLVAGNAAAKMLVMVLSGLVSVVTTRLIIEHFGLPAYAQYGLLASMAAWVPFADLGMSAAIMNTVGGSADPARDEHVRRVLTSAVRVLLGSAAVLALVGLLLGVTGAWPTVLGEGLLDGGGTVATVCVLVFAATLPLGVGPRLLTGLGLNHLQIRVQLLPAPFMLGSVLLLLLLGDDGTWLAMFSFLGGTVVAGVSLWVAARRVRPQLGAALADVPRVRSVPGARVMDVAWPMLAQMVALPIAMQTDRLLLSHLSTTNELAQYNLASQLFGLIVQTVMAAGIALWPVFAKARADGEVRSPVGLAGGFLVAGLGAGLLLAALLPVATPLLSDGRISLDAPLVAGFVAFVAVQAAKYPLGMYLTDARGLRFQVAPILVLVPLNLVMSWLLVAPLGAAGPVWGSALAVLLCQVLPNLWYVRRDLAARRLATG
ncbi:lipopolysaccharide biosynthesis protein [Luteipulveratus flavus]|uniref:Polysaccharide biosynthesis protein n=1 Tax=Luteipulveratus flavus TaxID=3031728 RepID=A0ABT6CDW7_9MICO|nr:oligosaccharide flippase family protein [Luteipulveratus sp. YIM 133296]MDF8266472.1 polysaccharide biosynthesis protein [Luteipulveratus sp. YIM 133296]